MKHAEHGGLAQLPDEARDAWEALGWRETDAAPVDPDPAMAEHTPRPAPEPAAVEEPTDEAAAEPADTKPSKTKKTEE